MRTFTFLITILIGTCARADGSIVLNIPQAALEVAMANTLGAESVEIRFLRPYDTQPKTFDINFVAKLRDKQFQLDCLLREHGPEQGALVALSYMVEIRKDECIVTSDQRPSDTLKMHLAGFSVDGFFLEGSRVIFLPAFFLFQIAKQMELEQMP